MTAQKTFRLRHGAAGLALLVAALLYLLTLDNGLRPQELVGGDLITHQYAQVEARPSNAPGYPLYTMGGWLWFRLGSLVLGRILNPIQILSLYSTLWGLVSLLVLYLILLNVTDDRRLTALLLTLFYATTFFFWYYSVTTEQYTSAVCQTLLVIWLAFKWEEQPRNALLLWLAFISGTMLANMVTTLFILPPLLWFIFSRRTAEQETLLLFRYLRQPKLMLQAVGLTLLPLLSYAYIYLRGAQHPEWRGTGNWQTPWDWFIQYLTIQQGRAELRVGLTWQNFFTEEFPALMWQELTWIVFLGGLIGLAFLGRRRAIFLTSTLLIYLIFSWSYRFGNWFQVIIPAYPIFVIGFAAGVRRISELASQRVSESANGQMDKSANGQMDKWANRQMGKSANGQLLVTNFLSFVFHRLSFFLHHLPCVSRQGSSPALRFPAGFIILILAVLLVYRFAASLPDANQRNQPDDTGLDPGWAILADQPVAPAIIAGTFEERVALQYLQVVWGAAPWIYPTEAGNFDPPAAANASNLSIYTTRQAVASAPSIIQSRAVHPQAAGEQLIGLWPTPRTELPGEAIPLDADFGDNLKLVGWEPVETANPFSPELSRANWQIALYWSTTATLADDYTISMRPLDGGQFIVVAGENVIQDHQPVWDVYPTSRWVPGEIVRDVYALSLPAETAPDAIQIVVYKTTTTGFENLAERTIKIEMRK